MNKQSLINPFSLLGITTNSTFNELKKNYYNMALMCHPDKGGSNDDMIIIQKAYNYCKEQLQSQELKQTTYQQLEFEFAEFCQKQESQTPTFSSIYEETNDWIKDFNNTFEQLNIENNNNHSSNNDDNLVMLNPFEQGYGELMDTSEDISQLPNMELEYQDIEDKQPNQVFNKEIVEYKEPQFLPDTINHFPLNCNKIDDFSGSTSNNQLIMTDYYRSYGKHKELKEEDYEFRDFPHSK